RGHGGEVVVGVGVALVAASATGPAPVVEQLVAGHADEPRHAELDVAVLLHRGDSGQERLAGEVLSYAGIAAAGDEVPEDVADGAVVEREQRVTPVVDDRLR